ncbi:MAG: hypothetical protein NUV97_00610 [archaeon]|nr:hypothetical protein [archaeon]
MNIVITTNNKKSYYNNNKVVKIQSQEEIEQEEELKRKRRENKLKQQEYGKYFIVEELNRLFDNGRGEKKVINCLKKKRIITINGKREIDTTIENMMEIINTKGVIVLLRILNNQYLRSCIETTTPGRRDKIKVIGKKKIETTKKEIIDNQIKWNIISTMKNK